MLSLTAIDETTVEITLADPAKISPTDGKLTCVLAELKTMPGVTFGFVGNGEIKFGTIGRPISESK